MTTVLIVDDLSSIREFLKINLSSEPDIKVIGLAEDGRGAIAQVEEHQPDIVLMDINMPGEIDGIQAAERIVSRFPQSKILLLTSQDDRQQLDRALTAGARGYILKNTSIKDIASIIRLTEKGFFQIGPILGNWDNTLHGLAQIGAGNLEMGREAATERTEIITHDFNYPPEASRASEMNFALSNLSSELFKLQETIRSQEDTIVNLTHQYSQVQHEINNKLKKEQLGSAYPSGSPGKNKVFTFYGSKFTKNRRRKEPSLLFIGSFLLGIMTVLFLGLLVAVVKQM
jgi:DNA-binding NarL/FixJ family response regulator